MIKFVFYIFLFSQFIGIPNSSLEKWCAKKRTIDYVEPDTLKGISDGRDYYVRIIKKNKKADIEYSLFLYKIDENWKHAVRSDTTKYLHPITGDSLKIISLIERDNESLPWDKFNVIAEHIYTLPKCQYKSNSTIRYDYLAWKKDDSLLLILQGVRIIVDPSNYD